MQQEFRVDADGAAIACRIDGEQSNGPWIVFSNSLITDLSVWDDQVEVLRQRYRILRYDQRGHGRTGIPPAQPTFGDLAGDVIAVLDHCGIDCCTFVGLSMGTPTGLHLYSRHPQRIERLVFSDGQAATADTGAATWQERIDFARQHGMDAVADRTVKRWFGDGFIASGQAERARRMMAGIPLEGYVACASALQNYDYASVLPTISVPTLLLAGAQDGSMPATMRRMSEIIPGAKMVEIPDAGHIPNYENPRPFNQALLGFLQETEARSITQ